MSARGYWTHRAARFALIGAASAVAVALLSDALPSPRVIFRLSMGTAYASLLLLATSLAIGPLQVLRRRPNPVSTDLRRDVGIWAALVGIVHVILGAQVHLQGRMRLYFLYPAEESHLLPLRHDAFGAANWIGVIATLLLLLLLGISNDVALRRLGARLWKTVQRWNYAIMAGVVLHGALYQAIEKRDAPLVLIMSAIAAATLVLQAAAFARVRRDRASR